MTFSRTLIAAVVFAFATGAIAAKPKAKTPKFHNYPTLDRSEEHTSELQSQ